eukprot:CAMPEP_0119363810 /NCGR_PEP_ID=MMETSP1334-20130426/10731_1 /TAXON_ID=127549 /ORGANISM="Calcidiscus leptoporus, Strain RCC1130" /LENGTH=72 /DNA_ID=CAMNT_0007379353 /DNA_START=231 /DNA_END=449 /DNA_ORIENTATION=+
MQWSLGAVYAEAAREVDERHAAPLQMQLHHRLRARVAEGRRERVVVAHERAGGAHGGSVSVEEAVRAPQLLL